MLKTLRFIVALAAALTLAPAIMAQAFPSKPVKIIVPFSPGTAADIVARQLGVRLGEMWGQGVVVENLAGAGGNIGAGKVAQSAPDGYTLMMVGINHVINPSLYKDVPYDLARDFKPVVRVAVAPLVIVTNSKFGPNNIQELIALAKAKPDSIRYGSGGNGSITQLSIELLKFKMGIKMIHVPYKSVAPMLTDLLGGQIEIGSPAAASVVSHAKAGTLKILAVTTAKRSPVMPNVPSVQESGVPDYDVASWNGLLAPTGTPDAVIEKIYADVKKVAQSKEFIEQLQLQALDISLMRPEVFGPFMLAEQDKWSRLVRASGAKVD